MLSPRLTLLVKSITFSYTLGLLRRSCSRLLFSSGFKTSAMILIPSFVCYDMFFTCFTVLRLNILVIRIFSSRKKPASANFRKIALAVAECFLQTGRTGKILIIRSNKISFLFFLLAFYKKQCNLQEIGLIPFMEWILPMCSLKNHIFQQMLLKPTK